MPAEKRCDSRRLMLTSRVACGFMASLRQRRMARALLVWDQAPRCG